MMQSIPECFSYYCNLEVISSTSPINPGQTNNTNINTYLTYCVLGTIVVLLFSP